MHSHSYDCENSFGEIACGMGDNADPTVRIDRLVIYAQRRMNRRFVNLGRGSSQRRRDLWREAYLLYDALRGIQFRSGSRNYGEGW